MGKQSRIKKERRDATKNLVLWHYTTSMHIKKIFEYGALKPTAILIDQGERPAVWLSSNSDWERTVTKQIKIGNDVTPKLQRDDLVKVGITPVRIRIDAGAIKIYDWKRFKKFSGIALHTAHELENVGLTQGANPSEWYACFDPIALDKWVSIDFWIDNDWVVHNIDEYSSSERMKLGG